MNIITFLLLFGRMNAMRLQVALDLIDIGSAIRLVKELDGIADIIEIGTPFIIKDGIMAVTKIKNAYPELIILADLKIMDAGEHEAKIAFDAGADIVTVLGAANDSTIQGVVKEARKYGKQVMADMIAVTDIRKRTKEIDRTGVDYICIHTASDVQAAGRNPLEELILVREIIRNAKIAVAGGINPETLKLIIAYKPEIVVVGSAITGKPDKRAAAIEMKNIML
jgi:3-hexulose-6-phosphate synthase